MIHTQSNYSQSKKNCIDYQYLFGLIPENSDSERREFIISSRSLLTSSDLGQLHNSMPHK